MAESPTKGKKRKSYPRVSIQVTLNEGGGYRHLRRFTLEGNGQAVLALIEGVLAEYKLVASQSVK